MSDAHRLYTRTFWTACAMHFTGGMSFGMFLLFPLYVRAVGGDQLTIGLVLGTGLGASVALRPFVGTLLDRLGRRRMLVWASAANAASFPLLLGARAVGPLLYLLATFHFVVGGVLFAAYFTYAADIVPAARRVEGIAIFGVAGMAPNGLGPALGEAMIGRAGYPAFFLAAAAFALASLALASLLPERRASDHAVAAAPGRDLLRAALHGRLGRLMAATVLFGAGTEVAFFFVAPFVQDLGMPRASPFFAAYASTTIALRVLGRRTLDRVVVHRLVVPGFAVFALGLALLCALPAPGILVVSGIACGAGHGSLFPLLSALAVTRTPARAHGTVVSLYTAALDLGAVIGTPAGGAVARLLGYRAMFLMVALASVVGLALMAVDGREPAAA